MPWLTDRKWAYIRMEGTAFGDVPLNLELKLEVWDSPNSAGIVIDAVRLAKLALNNGISGALEAPSSYLMKSPPVQIRRRRGCREHGEVHQAVRPQGREEGEGREGLVSCDASGSGGHPRVAVRCRPASGYGARGAVSSASKPASLCVVSQKGLFFE